MAGDGNTTTGSIQGGSKRLIDFLICDIDTTVAPQLLDRRMQH